MEFEEDDIWSESRSQLEDDNQSENQPAKSSKNDDSENEPNEEMPAKKGVPKRTAEEEDYLNRLQEIMNKADPPVPKKMKKEKEENEVVVESLDQLRKISKSQLEDKVKKMSKDYFTISKKAVVKKTELPKINHDCSISHLVDKFIKSQSKIAENIGDDLARCFVTFLQLINFEHRVLYFVELNGYYPRRFAFRRLKKENKDSEDKEENKKEKAQKFSKDLTNLGVALNHARVVVQMRTHKRWETLETNTVDKMLYRLRGKNLIAVFMMSFGADRKLQRSEVSPIVLPEQNWSQVLLNQKNLQLNDLIQELSENSALLPEEQKTIQEALETRIPQSTYEFRLNPLYIVRSALKKNEIIVDNAKPSPYFYKTEPVYYKTDMVVLQSGLKWRMEGRKVRDGEEPMKILHREVWQKPIKLYSESQTELWKHGLVDGHLPINEFNNVELFNGVPEGCVHMKMKGVWRACKALGVEYKAAVTGFDKRNGRSFPVKEGIVVLSKDAKAIRQKWKEMKKDIEAKEQQQKDKAIIDEWKKLFKLLMIKRYVNQNY